MSENDQLLYRIGIMLLMTVSLFTSAGSGFSNGYQRGIADGVAICHPSPSEGETK